MEELWNSVSHVFLLFAFPRLKTWPLKVSLLILLTFSTLYHLSMYLEWGGPWRDLDHLGVTLFVVVSLETVWPTFWGWVFALGVVVLSFWSNYTAFLLALLLVHPAFWINKGVSVSLFALALLFFFIDRPYFHLVWHLLVFLAIYLVAPHLSWDWYIEDSGRRGREGSSCSLRECI